MATRKQIVKALEAAQVPPAHLRPGLSFSDFGNAGQVIIPARAVQVFSPKRRCTVKITNLGTVDVYLGFNSNVTVNSGDLLVGLKGSWVAIETNAPIWAVASESARVSFLELVHQ